MRFVIGLVLGVLGTVLVTIYSAEPSHDAGKTDTTYVEDMLAMQKAYEAMQKALWDDERAWQAAKRKSLGLD